MKNTWTLTLLYVYIGMRLNVRVSIIKTVEDLRKFRAIKKPKFVNFWLFKKRWQTEYITFVIVRQFGWSGMLLPVVDVGVCVRFYFSHAHPFTSLLTSGTKPIGVAWQHSRWTENLSRFWTCMSLDSWYRSQNDSIFSRQGCIP